MPFKIFAILLTSVICAAGLTIWVASHALSQAGVTQPSWAYFLAIPLLVFGLWRLLSKQLK